MEKDFFNELNEPEKLDYVKNAVPTSTYKKAAEKGGFEDNNSINEGEIIANFDEFLEHLESVYRSHQFIRHLNRKGSPKFLKKISEKTQDSQEIIKEEYELKELLYWKTHFKNNRKVAQFVKFTDEEPEELFGNVEEQKELEDVPDSLEERLENILEQELEFKKALSKLGSDIWNIMGEDPAPYIARIDFPYLIIEFRSKSSTSSIFDERRGEYIEAQRTKRSAIRLDFNSGLAELQGFTSLNDGPRSRLEEELETIFHGEIDLDDPIEINDGFIRYMDDRIEEVDLDEHEGSSVGRHEGRSRSKNSGDDIHEDPVYESDILPRDHLEKSIDYDLDQVRFLGDNDIKINFSVESDALQIFRDKLIPRDRRKVAEFVFDHYTTFVDEHEPIEDEEDDN